MGHDLRTAVLAAAAEAGAKASASTGWLLIVTTLAGLIGGLGGVVTLINLPKMRKKQDADTAQVLSNTAVTLVEPLTKQMVELRGRVQHLETYGVLHRQVLGEHAAWDHLAIRRLQQAGVHIDPPPPLFPADPPPTPDTPPASEA